MPMEVIKFGGSSLVDAAAMRQVAALFEGAMEFPCPSLTFVLHMGGDDALNVLAKASTTPTWKSMVDDHARTVSASR